MQPRHADTGWSNPMTDVNSSTHHSAISRSHARNQSVAPASPELISSLITSLSVISRPTTDELDQSFDFGLDPAPSLRSSHNQPVARRMGSFGVDYGAFSKPSSSELRDHSFDLDELAAAAPVIKTAKPPSGYSALTSPKSPTSGGLRSFLGGRNTSRPSSRGSSASKDADVHSVGNISVERGQTPGSSPAELKQRRSADSWGKKASQTHSRLIHGLSKERLTAEEKRRVSSADNGNGLSNSAMAWPMGRSESYLGETPIDEEPMFFDSLAASQVSGLDSHMPLQSIPHRDSSLRKTGANAKRQSGRANRSSRRNSSNNAIPEEEFGGRGLQGERDGEVASLSRRGSYGGTETRPAQDSRTGRNHDDLLNPTWSTTVKANHHIDHYVTDTEVSVDEDGAPAPSIAQGKRRDREVNKDRHSRRMSGSHTPEPRLKRSSSKLKRRSGATSPREDKVKDDAPYERPPSADSIDDSVQAYMRSPRLSQKIKHPQTGRVISFSEVGDSEGSAVFCCVGMGLTRYITAFYDELALTLKLRLITPDRPGVGDSEAYADGTATPLSWPGEQMTLSG